MRSKLVEPKVERILKDDLKFRSSDRRLLLEYWERYDGLRLSPEQRAKFLQATPAESITRARRNLRDKYPGDEQTEEARYGRFIEERMDNGEMVVIFNAETK